MAKTSEKQIASEVAENELTLNNALSVAEILGLISPRGYPAERLEEGLVITRTVRSKQAAKDGALGAQTAATAGFQAAFGGARMGYADFRETARAHYGSAVESPGPWLALGLAGSAPTDTEGFLGAAYACFDNALADEATLADLTIYGYDAAGIQAERAKVEGMDAANQAQERAKGAKLRATAERDEAYRAMKRWMGAFKRIVRRVLKDRPDLLVKLGL